MLLSIEQLNNNYKVQKYRRIFIFGCSFTNYWWPTWANILHNDMPNATCYNFGSSGGGNLFIAAQLTAANQKYKFNPYDLIIPHWSTYCREDRYIRNGWLTPGNIYTQNYYDENFIRKFACAKGYLVRDLAIISLTKHTLEKINCDSIMLQAVPPTYDSKYFDEDGLNEVADLYKNILDVMPPSLYDLVAEPNDWGSKSWINGHQYFKSGHTDNYGIYQDYHPNPARYLNYLDKLGINISDRTRQLVEVWNNRLLSFKNHDEILAWNDEVVRAKGNYFPNEQLI